MDKAYSMSRDTESKLPQTITSLEILLLCGRDMIHRVENEVVGQDRVA